MIQVSRRSLGLGVAAILAPAAAWAQRRRRVVVRRRRVVLRPGHPILRAANRTVVVRAPRRAFVVAAPLVFLPVVAFAAAVAVLPARERLLWQDTETIHRDEEWVESNFGIDERGDALYIEVRGRAELDFADVSFENGEVQVVDFKERTYESGIYGLLDFPGRRNVKTVRLVARSKSEDTTFQLYLGS